jgi:hypothetical protein
MWATLLTKSWAINNLRMKTILMHQLAEIKMIRELLLPLNLLLNRRKINKQQSDLKIESKVTQSMLKPPDQN